MTAPSAREPNNAETPSCRRGRRPRRPARPRFKRGMEQRANPRFVILSERSESKDLLLSACNMFPALHQCCSFVFLPPPRVGGRCREATERGLATKVERPLSRAFAPASLDRRALPARQHARNDEVVLNKAQRGELYKPRASRSFDSAALEIGTAFWTKNFMVK